MWGCCVFAQLLHSPAHRAHAEEDSATQQCQENERMSGSFAMLKNQTKTNKHCKLFVLLGLNSGVAESLVDKRKCVRDPAALLPEFSCTAISIGTSSLAESSQLLFVSPTPRF